jgi:outer membrane protein assembly factor BamB
MEATIIMIVKSEKKHKRIGNTAVITVLILIGFLTFIPACFFKTQSLSQGLPTRNVTEIVTDEGLLESQGSSQLNNNSSHITITNLKVPENQPVIEWIMQPDSEKYLDKFGWKNSKILVDSDGRIWIGHEKSIKGAFPNLPFLTRMNPDGSLDWQIEIKAPIAKISPVIALNGYVICLSQVYSIRVPTDNVKEYFECYDLKGNRLWVTEIAQNKVDPEMIFSFDSKVMRVSKEYFVLESGIKAPYTYNIYSLRNGELLDNFEYSPVFKNGLFFLDEKTFLDLARDKEASKGILACYSTDLSIKWTNKEFNPDLDYSPQITRDGKIIITDVISFEDRVIYAIDPQSGNTLWKFDQPPAELFTVTESSKIICRNGYKATSKSFPDMTILDSNGQIVNSCYFTDRDLLLDYNSAVVYGDDGILCAQDYYGQSFLSMFDMNGNLHWKLSNKDLQLPEKFWSEHVFLFPVGENRIVMEIGDQVSNAYVISLSF